MSERRTTEVLEDRLDMLATEASHDGFEEFGGSEGAAETFMEELGFITDRIVRLESDTALSILRDVIDDLQASLDNQDG